LGWKTLSNSLEKSAEAYGLPKKSLGEIFYYVVCGLIFLFLVAPVFIVIPISFSSSEYLEFPPKGFSLQWYQSFFQSNEWVSAALNSIKVAIMTSILATFLGIPAALSLARHKFKGAQFIYSFLISPMIIPVIITAIAVYFQFARLKFIGNIYSLVLAHTILSIPIVIITVSAALQGFDVALEYAAMSLGANRIKTFFKVTFPIIRPGVISGALFAFITSFDEVVIAVFLGTYRSITLPKHMWSIIREEIDPTIAAVSTILIFVSIFMLLSVTLLVRRGERLRS
jgi:putative spermidine/putrescine transport system permease protein